MYGGARARVGALALYLPTARPRASSPLTDSPFRMSRRRASQHEHTSPTGAETSRVKEPQRRVNCTTSFSIRSVARSNNEPSRLEHEAVRERGRVRERGQSSQSGVQMCSQDVPRDWVCDPSSPPLPFPLADDDTAANTDPPPNTHTHTHTHAQHNTATLSPPSSQFTLSTALCDIFKCCWKIQKCQRHTGDN